MCKGKDRDLGVYSQSMRAMSSGHIFNILISLHSNFCNDSLFLGWARCPSTLTGHLLVKISVNSLFCLRSCLISKQCFKEFLKTGELRLRAVTVFHQGNKRLSLARMKGCRGDSISLVLWLIYSSWEYLMLLWTFCWKPSSHPYDAASFLDWRPPPRRR